MWWRRHSSIFLQMRPVSTLLVKESQSKYLAPTGICLKGARWYQDLWNRQHTCCLLHLVSVRPSNAQHFSTTPEPKRPPLAQSKAEDLTSDCSRENAKALAWSAGWKGLGVLAGAFGTYLPRAQIFPIPGTEQFGHRSSRAVGLRVEGSLSPPWQTLTLRTMLNVRILLSRVAWVFHFPPQASASHKFARQSLRSTRAS